MYHASFKQLQALLLVARHESVSRAADALHVTQPAVSLQLRMLEEAAGTPLTRRVGRGIQLTAAGEVMVGFAGRILGMWEEAADEIAALRGVISGTLRIGAITTAEYILPPMLVSFTTERPDVRIKLRVGNRNEIVNMLSKHEVDLAIMGTPPHELRTNAARFARHPMAFVASPNHPLMKRKRVSLSDIMETILLVRERGSGTRTAVERLYKDAGYPLRIGSELSSNEAIKRMVVAGLGVAFLSMHACTLEFEAGLVRMLPMHENPVEADWYVMHLIDKPIPIVAAAFQDFVIERGQAEVRAQLRAFHKDASKPRTKVDKPATGQRRASS